MGALLACALISFALPEVARGDDFERELRAIRTVESSGGLNVNHKLLTRGLHRGTRAGGEYGIMPITARETILKSKRRLVPFRHYSELSNSELTELLNEDREFDGLLASYMWGKLRERFTKEQAACAWFWGPRSHRCATHEKAQQDSYVIKFNRAYSAELFAGND